MTSDVEDRSGAALRRVARRMVDGSNVVEQPFPLGLGMGLLWSPDGERYLSSSMNGILSVPVAPGAFPVAHSRDELKGCRVRGRPSRTMGVVP